MNSSNAAKITGAVLILALCGSCSDRTRAPAGRGAPEKHSPLVEAVKPAPQDFERTIVLTASIEAFEQAPLYAKVSGYVKALNVDIGDRVQQGQELATLEVPEMTHQLASARAAVAEQSAAVAKAEADAELARVIFVRAEGLRKKDAITEQELDEARARHLTAQADAELARARHSRAKSELNELDSMMAYSRIRAPFAGVITRRFIDPGALVQAATANNNVTPIVTVSKTEVLRAVVEVPEPDAPYVRKGDPTSIRLVAMGSRALEAHVSRTADALDPGTRTMRAEADLQNPQGSIAPGMFGELTIHARRAALLTIPARTLHKDESGAFVLVIHGGRLHKRPVATGASADGVIEILDGISPDDLVAASDAELKDGQAVEVRPYGEERAAEVSK
jgi:RND family efflux transporter MFP subunit